MWVSKVRRAGGALTITLPRGICRDFFIERGDLVLVRSGEQGTVLLNKVSQGYIETLERNFGLEIKQTSDGLNNYENPYRLDRRPKTSHALRHKGREHK